MPQASLEVKRAPNRPLTLIDHLAPTSLSIYLHYYIPTSRRVLIENCISNKNNTRVIKRAIIESTSKYYINFANKFYFISSLSLPNFL